MQNLTPKQQRFCEEYVIDLNGAQAAIRSGYSEKTAKSIASENLTKPDVKHFINELQKEKSKRLQVSADDLIKNLMTVANKDPDSETTKAKYSNRLKAVELLGRHITFFNDKLEVQTEQKPQVIIVRNEKYDESELLGVSAPED
jgi:phage terminase small subunit